MRTIVQIFVAFSEKLNFKVQIFWEGHKILKDLPIFLTLLSNEEKLGDFFSTFCGLLRISELYLGVSKITNLKPT